jgi:hypothetical protein
MEGMEEKVGGKGREESRGEGRALYGENRPINGCR